MLATTLVAGVAHAAGDAVKGEQVYKKCFACHMVGPEAKVKVGPVLNDIFGRPAGAQEEYGAKYSKDMVEAGKSGFVWTEETLDTYLESPKGTFKKTKMAFVGLKKEEERQDVIAYLLQFSPDYKPAQ